MESFITIGHQASQIGISDLKPVHCQVIKALIQKTELEPSDPKDVRRQYRTMLDAVKRADVTIMSELYRHVGLVHAERHLPELTLQDIAFCSANPENIHIPSKFNLQSLVTWKHRSLVQHVYGDRLYQSSDVDLADPRRILILTMGRCGEILGVGITLNHDRPTLLAMYAATLLLEAEMRIGHPRFVANICGKSAINRHRIRIYTSALDFLRVHIENLLRVAPEHA